MNLTRPPCWKSRLVCKSVLASATFLQAGSLSDAIAKEVQFRTAYVATSNNRQTFVTDARAIARKYARGWLPVDFAATFPFDAVVSLVWPHSDLLVLRMFKLPRLLRMGRLTRRIDSRAAAVLARMAYLLVGIFLISHWVGCLWFLLGRLELELVVDPFY